MCFTASDVSIFPGTLERGNRSIHQDLLGYRAFARIKRLCPSRRLTATARFFIFPALTLVTGGRGDDPSPRSNRDRRQQPISDMERDKSVPCCHGSTINSALAYAPGCVVMHPLRTDTAVLGKDGRCLLISAIGATWV